MQKKKEKVRKDQVGTLKQENYEKKCKLTKNFITQILKFTVGTKLKYYSKKKSFFPFI